MVPCIEILLKPKSSSEGLIQLCGYLAQSISLCDSDARGDFALAAGGYCQIMEFTLTVYRVCLLTLLSKGGLHTVPGSSLLF